MERHGMGFWEKLEFLKGLHKLFIWKKLEFLKRLLELFIHVTKVSNISELL